MKSISITTLIAAIAMVSSCGKEESMPVKESAVPAISAEDLSAVAAARIFFGHQSVGKNIIDGISELAAARGLPPPSFIESKEVPKGRGGFFLHEPIGKNTDPFSKMRDFASILRGGVGDAVDLAFMKFCYIDVVRDTDVNALFAEYRSMIAALEREYPKVVFLHCTIPLTTRRTDIKGRIKDVLGMNDNPARERMNALLRKEYGGGDRLFDIASVESAAPDGRSTYFALAPAYAADEGHLNAAGRAAAAESLLGVIAYIVRK